MWNEGTLNETLEPMWKSSGILHELHQLKLARVQNGDQVFDFSMINPDIPPPRSVIDKLVQASLKGFNHRYGVSRGIKKLREAFVFKYQSAFGVTLDPADEVCVTLGCKDATLHLFKIISAQNKRVVVFEPCYPPYLSAAAYHGISIERVSWIGDERQALDSLSNILKGNQIGAVVVNFPMNPCGDTVSVDFWHQLVALAKTHNCLIINDFAYGELVHLGVAPSFLSVPGATDVGVEIYTMSKAYSIPGWRVAAVMGNRAVVDAVSRIKSRVDYGMFLPVQIAATGALCEGASVVAPIKDAYFRRLKVLVEGLNKLGWHATLPAAGACVWAGMSDSLKERYKDGFKLAQEMLQKSGIAVLPGEAFGVSGARKMRFAAVLPEDKIRESLQTLGDIWA